MSELLIDLTCANLVTAYPSGRYGSHDLLCAFAYRQTLAIDTEDEHNAAMYRAVDHYLQTAYAAAQLLAPDQPLDNHRANPTGTVAGHAEDLDSTPKGHRDGQHGQNRQFHDHGASRSTP